MAPWVVPTERAGILCFRMPGIDVGRTAEDLAAADLVVSRRGRWIRLAPHATTDPEVAGMLAEAL